MRFAIFKGEKSVADLATRLFRVQGRGSQATMKQAAEALLKANPQLNDLSKVPVGSLIAIPDKAPPVAPEEQAVSVGLVRSLAALNIQSAFDFLQKRLSDIETTAAERLKSGTDRMQTPEIKAGLKSAAQQNFVVGNQMPSLDSIAKDTKEILRDLQTAQDARKQALTQLRTALISLAK